MKDEPLTDSERDAFRSATYKVAWVGTQGRPEVAGTASISASRIENAVIEDVKVLNKAIDYLKSTANMSLKLWKFEDPIFLSVSDAAGVGMVEHGGTQGAHLIMMAERGITGGDSVKTSVVAWKSNRIKRVVASTLAAETLALSSSLSASEWSQIMYRDLRFGNVQRESWESDMEPINAMMRGGSDLSALHEELAVMDAKSLYDVLNKGKSHTSQADRRTCIEICLCREALARTGGKPKWIPHWKMPADMLTKVDVSG